MKVQIALASNVLSDAEAAKFVTKEVHDHIQKRIRMLGLLFPGAMRFLKGVKYTHSTTNEYDVFSREFRFSTAFTRGTVADANREASRANKPGFVVHGGPTEAFDALIAHEFGHLVDNWIKQGLIGVENDDMLAEYQGRKKAFQKIYGNPSEYASKNLGEWFAEQFTKEYLGKGHDRPVFQLIQNVRDNFEI